MRSESKPCWTVDVTGWNARFARVATAVLQGACLLDKDCGKLDMLMCASCGYNKQSRLLKVLSVPDK